MWPQEQLSFFVQTAFVGKAKLIYSNLPSDQLDYDNVKKAILEAYDQVPETYRQKFRNLHKEEKQTYLEFVKEKERLFNAWLRASKVMNFEELRELVMLEEILNKVPYSLKMYLQEREVKTVNKAATLAENYRLTHGNFYSRQKQKGTGPYNPGGFNHNRSQGGGKPWYSGGGNGSGSSQTSIGVASGSTGKVIPPSSTTVSCAYCKQTGHHIRDCHKLKDKVKRPEPVLATSSIPPSLPTSEPANPMSKHSVLSACSDNSLVSHDSVIAGVEPSSCYSDQFHPFLSVGTVSSSDLSTKYPIHILRDTGASHSLVLKGVLPDFEDCSLGQSVLIQGLSGCIAVPLARVYLSTDLASGYFTVGVQDSLPVKGVSFLLGNDIAGNRVVPDLIVASSTSSSNNMAAQPSKLDDSTDSFKVDISPLVPDNEPPKVLAPSQELYNVSTNHDTDSVDINVSPLFSDDDLSKVLVSTEELNNVSIEHETDTVDIDVSSLFSANEPSEVLVSPEELHNVSLDQETDSIDIDISSLFSDNEPSEILTSPGELHSVPIDQETDSIDVDISSLFSDKITSPEESSNVSIDSEVDSVDVDVSFLFPDNETSQVLASPEVLGNIPIDCESLKEAQVEDSELAPFFHRVVEDSNIHKFPLCFYVRNGILMLKCRSPNVPTNESWNECHKVVVPKKFRSLIISVAHDLSGGHLGVDQTYHKICKDYFWPRMKECVAYYCKTCHECQVAEETNQPISPAPLIPIPATDELSSKVIIDCVGSLSKAHSGHEYSLTIMCSTTRHPDVFPTSQNVAKALSKFCT